MELSKNLFRPDMTKRKILNWLSAAPTNSCGIFAVFQDSSVLVLMRKFSCVCLKRPPLDSSSFYSLTLFFYLARSRFLSSRLTESPGQATEKQAALGIICQKVQ